MVVRRSALLPGLAVHVKPVASREVDHRSRRVAALVLIVDPVSRVRIEPDLVQAVLGLTPAETEIALLLAEGRTLRQIGATTGRGYSTVRTHLKHVFTKLGVSRQFEVAQRVLALSSLPARPGLETPAARARAASCVPFSQAPQPRSQSRMPWAPTPEPSEDFKVRTVCGQRRTCLSENFASSSLNWGTRGEPRVL